MSNLYDHPAKADATAVAETTAEMNPHSREEIDTAQAVQGIPEIALNYIQSHIRKDIDRLVDKEDAESGAVIAEIRALRRLSKWLDAQRDRAREVLSYGRRD